jgi:hypothetical protein
MFVHDIQALRSDQTYRHVTQDTRSELTTPLALDLLAREHMLARHIAARHPSRDEVQRRHISNQVIRATGVAGAVVAAGAVLGCVGLVLLFGGLILATGALIVAPDATTTLLGNNVLLLWWLPASAGSLIIAIGISTIGASLSRRSFDRVTTSLPQPVRAARFTAARGVSGRHGEHELLRRPAAPSSGDFTARSAAPSDGFANSVGKRDERRLDGRSVIARPGDHLSSAS